MSVKINNKEYAWGDISVNLCGTQVVGLKEISYTTSMDKEANYGAGRTPLGIQCGKRSFSGSISITDSELAQLQKAAKEKEYKDILDMEDVDIVVQYLIDESSTVTVDNITGVAFTEIPKGMSEGDLSSTHALGFICLNIDYDVEV